MALGREGVEGGCTTSTTTDKINKKNGPERLLCIVCLRRIKSCIKYFLRRARCVAAPDSLNSERKKNDPETTVDPAREHCTATVPTAVHAVTIPDTLGLRWPSLWGSGATQTSTSACACCTYAERSRSGDAFSRRTSRRITKQIAATWISDRTTQPGSLQTKPPTNCAQHLAMRRHLGSTPSRA